MSQKKQVGCWFFLLMILPVFGAACQQWVVGMLTDRLLWTVLSLFTFISAQLVTICLLLNSTKSLIVFIFLRVHLPSLSWIEWHRRTYLALLTVNYYILQLKWRDIFIIVSHNGIFLRQTLGTRKESTCVSILFFFYVLSSQSWNQNPELSWFYKLHYENLELFRHKIVNNFIVVSSSSSIQYNIPNVSPSIAMYWKDS